MKPLLRGLMAAGALCAIAGCASLFPSRGPNLTVQHDFGPSPTYHPQATVPILLRVRAVPWLTGTTIHYRWAYQDPTAVYAYAENRWLAPPAVLLAARLRATLGPAPVATAPPPLYRLVVTIQSFSQDFETPSTAHVHVQIEGRLDDASNGQRLAVDDLNWRRPCPPSARGAIAGLSKLARQASRVLAAWAVAHARGPR
ncbi:MAG: ABC-type transport auxiliary lipoprotein family protein [Acidiferrobacter sp.]